MMMAAKKQPAAPAASTATGDGFTELGKTGLSQWNGMLSEEVHKDLQGAKGRKVFREMRELDPIQGAMMYSLEALTQNVTYDVEAGGNTTDDERARDLVKTGLDDMSFTWADTLSEINSRFTYGWAFLEVVYKHRTGDDGEVKSRFSDGLIGWRKWAGRAQDSLDKWVIDDNGGIQAMVQRPAPKFQLIELPIARGMLFRTSARKNSPEGYSLQHNAYLPYYIKKRIQVVEGIGITRDLCGLPMMYVPPAVMDAADGSAAATQREAAKKAVTRIQRDEQEGLVLPSVFDTHGNRLWDFKLATSGGARQFNTDAIIQRYEIRQAMTTLMDFLFVGHGNSGSYALHVDKTRLYALAIGGFVDSMLEVINRHEIPRLLAINGLRVTTPPKMTRGKIEEPDLAKIADYVVKLTGAGMPLFPDPALEEQLRGIAHLSGAEGAAATAKRNLPGQVAKTGADLIAMIRKMQATSEPVKARKKRAEGGAK